MQIQRFVDNRALHNARYSLYEAFKQILLLEAHLCDPEKRCAECIFKHFATIEAYVEEAQSLDGAERSPFLNDLHAIIERLRFELFENDRDCLWVSGQLRRVRKGLFAALSQ